MRGRFDAGGTQEGIEQVKEGVAAAPNPRVHLLAESSELFQLRSVHNRKDELSSLFLSTPDSVTLCCWLKCKLSSDFAHSSIPDAVWLTLKLRAESGLPLRIVLVHSNGYGDYYGIDASRPDAEGERPVVLWDDGLEVAAPDFGSFFLTGVRAALESEETDL